jgi:hypothetical protein
MRDVWTFVCITCPIAIAGMHYPISIYETLVANTVTYGVVGLIVETLRKQLHHAQYFKTAHPIVGVTSPFHQLRPDRGFWCNGFDS